MMRIFFNRFSMIMLLLTTGALFCTSIIGSAYGAQCSTKSGMIQNYNFVYQLNSSQNYVGYSSGWTSKSASGSWTIGGPCNPTQTLYFTGSPGPDLTLASSDGTTNWYDIQGNDYLQVASQILLYNKEGSDKYHDVPFIDVSNNCKGQCNGSVKSGSSVKVNIRIKKTFVGESTFSTTIFNLTANNGANQGVGPVLVSGKLQVSVTVPQNCVLNAGQIINVDFGNISSGAFRKAGAKAEGINPVTRTVGIQCKNIDAQASLTMRVQSDNISGNAIVSSNPDVGFVLTDSNNRELIPNNLSSFIPFKLDDSGSANVTIKVFPVSVTGNKPTEGVVTSLAYLRVDFA